MTHSHGTLSSKQDKLNQIEADANVKDGSTKEALGLEPVRYLWIAYAAG